MASALNKTINSIADFIQGTSHFLFAFKLVAVHDCSVSTKGVGILWNICSRLGRGSSGDNANQATWGKHVSETTFQRIHYR